MSTGPVLIMAGGTGGHVFPGLAVAAALKARQTSAVWLGSANSFESKTVPEHGLEFHAIGVSGVRGKGWRTKLVAPWMLTRSVFQALGVLRRVRPRAAMSFGGFAAGPGGLAARLLGIPLLVHEQNRVPGLTNRVLARFARRVLCGFPGSFETGNSEFVGNPVRSEISALALPEQRYSERDGALRVLCLGGSLGAKALNELLPQAVAMLEPGGRPLVVHQAGKAHLTAAKAAYQNAGLDPEVVVPFIADMAQAYGWADLVICRAGALTVAELACAGVAAILVPYPFAVDDHQTANARWLVEAGAAELIQQSELNAEQLAQKLKNCTRTACLTRARAARALAKADAAERCAKIILECAA